MNWILIIVFILLFIIFNKKKVEKFNVADFFKLQITNNTNDQTYELLTLSQLNINILSKLKDNLENLKLENIINKNMLNDFIENNKDPTFQPENDIIFAIKTQDLTNININNAQRLIAFSKEDNLPIYVSNALFFIKNLIMFPLPVGLAHIENFLSISLKSKKNMRPYTLVKNINNDNIDNKFIELQQIIIDNLTIYKVTTSDTQTTLTMKKKDL